MHYFAHTLKGCGPVALALVLTACGEETAGTSAAASGQSLEGTEAIAVDPQSYDEQTLAQRTAVAEVSSPAVGTHNGTTNTAVSREMRNGVRGVSQVMVAADMRSSSAPPAPTAGDLDRFELANGGSVFTAPGQNAKPGLEPITRIPADREYRDELPELPSAEIADGSDDGGQDNIEEPQDASLDLPVIGADPLVTLIATTDSDLNSIGTRLVWSAENVASCTASGAWEGDIAANGALDLQHSEAGDMTYMIKCEGASGTAMAMVTVTVESTALAWEAPVQNTNGSQLTDLAGYNLYYGTQSGRYTEVHPVRDASQTNLELPVESGTYYLAMTAYDMSGNESDLSNEIMRTVD